MPPSINQFKKDAGFKDGAPDRRLYLTWRDYTKQEMRSRGILGKTDPGRAAWADLTRWTLTKMPFSEKAALHGAASAAGMKFTQAVDGLLVDVCKKLSYTRSKQVNLEPPPQPEPPTLG